MIGALAIFGIIIAGLTVVAALKPQWSTHNAASSIAAHNMTTGPTINYSANPFRTGAYVYVMETSTPSEHDWAGTFIGMADGMAMVRDIDTHVVAHVNKDQLYGANR